jgi:hypothetical protein
VIYTIKYFSQVTKSPAMYLLLFQAITINYYEQQHFVSFSLYFFSFLFISLIKARCWKMSSKYKFNTTFSNRTFIKLGYITHIQTNKYSLWINYFSVLINQIIKFQCYWKTVLFYRNNILWYNFGCVSSAAQSRKSELV